MNRKSVLSKLFFMFAGVLSVVMFLVSYAGSGKDYIVDSTTAPDGASVEGDVHYENLPITYESTMPEDIPELVRVAVTEMPVGALKEMIAGEWKIAIVSVVEVPEGANISAKVDDTATVIGVTDYKTKTIQVLYGESQRSILVPLEHELCHFCDSYYGNLYFADDALYGEEPAEYLASFTKGFQRLYVDNRTSYVEYEKAGIARTEANRIDFEYPVSNCEEFFVCAMKDYLLHPEYLKKNYPDLFAYFTALEDGNASLIRAYYGG